MIKPLEIILVILFLSLSGLLKAQDSIITPPPEVCPGDRMVHYGVDAESVDGANMFDWFIEGGEIINQVDYPDKSLITVNWFDGADHYTLKVMEISETAKCVGDTSLADVGIKETPRVDIGQNIYRCANDPPVRFDAGNLDDGIIDYYWQDGSRGRYHVASEPGMYSVITVGENGCQTIDSVELTVYEPPKVDLGEDFMVGTEDTTLAPEAMGSYEWSTGDISPTLTITSGEIEDGEMNITNDDTISVTVTDAYGCIDQDTVIAKKYTSRINVPSVITPNGDGVNDEWVLEDLQFYHQAVVTVYDRWGNIVFQSNGSGNYEPWDGKYNGNRLPMDSYHYIIDLKDGMPKITGNLTIMR